MSFLNLLYIVVILQVGTAQFNITEPDDESSTITVCFMANINQTLQRQVNFQLQYLDSESSASMADIYINGSSNITIFPGFFGDFRECIDLVVAADEVVEENEVAIYAVIPENDVDAVENARISISIMDTDGMHN